MKEDKIFFSGGQDLCVWNEKGELLDKMARNSEHCMSISFEMLTDCMRYFLINANNLQQFMFVQYY